MAISNYAELKAAVQKWSKREDVKDLIDDFIDLCEVRIYANDVEPLRLRSMVQDYAATTNTADRFLTLPEGYISSRRFRLELNDDRYRLEYVTPEALVMREGSGTPRYFTVTDQIEFDVIPDEAYTVDFKHYGRLTALSQSDPVNAILTDYPTIYLYGTLIELFDWAENDAQMQKYRSRFVEAINGANYTDEEGNRGVASRKNKRGRNP